MSNSPLNGKEGLERKKKESLFDGQKKKRKSSQKDKGVDKRRKIILKMSLIVFNHAAL